MMTALHDLVCVAPSKICTASIPRFATGAPFCCNEQNIGNWTFLIFDLYVVQGHQARKHFEAGFPSWDTYSGFWVPLMCLDLPGHGTCRQYAHNTGQYLQALRLRLVCDGSAVVRVQGRCCRPERLNLQVCDLQLDASWTTNHPQLSCSPTPISAPSLHYLLPNILPIV